MRSIMRAAIGLVAILSLVALPGCACQGGSAIAAAGKVPAAVRTDQGVAVSADAHDIAIGGVVMPDVPDSRLSPGAVRSTDLRTIVATERATERRRPDEWAKRAVFAAYGIPWARHSCCEVDHLVSIEIGGSNDTRNLWPEHYVSLTGHPGARVKDRYEDWLGAQIRNGKITPADAQYRIAHDWIAHYRRDLGQLPTDPPPNQ